MNGKRRKAKETVSAFPGQHRESKYGVYKLLNSIGVLMIIVLLVVIGAQYVQHVKVQQELEAYEARLLGHEQRQQDLEIEIRHLQETGYIEALARDRLGLVKPDEIIFQLED